VNILKKQTALTVPMQDGAINGLLPCWKWILVSVVGSSHKISIPCSWVPMKSIKNGIETAPRWPYQLY